MVTKKYMTEGLIIAAAVAVVLIFFVDWEARAIKKQLHSLAKEMTWTASEDELTLVSRVKSVQDKIADNCKVNVPSYEVIQTIPRSDVPSYLAMAKNYYRNFSLEFEDLKIESIRIPQARAVTTAHIKAIAADNQRNDEVLVLEFILQKVDKKWQIKEAKEVKVLEK